MEAKGAKSLMNMYLQLFSRIVAKKLKLLRLPHRALHLLWVDPPLSSSRLPNQQGQEFQKVLKLRTEYFMSFQ